MSTPVEQVKDRLNIVDVVGQYVKLTKAGKSWRGLSPFKKEKTPSFYVSPDRGMYYCFSSQKGGDIFTFVQEMEGVDFRGALKILAERAGVELVYERGESRDDRERQYHLLEEATVFFEKRFAAEPDAEAYLALRGMTAESMKKWRIGFAPPEWSALHTHLRAQGYTDVEMERVGLVKRGEKSASYYDRFRSRIIFPIADSAGRIIAFSGRIFAEAARDKENAKYLNSPETPLFDKSRTLYGYDHARQTIRKYDFSIIVEGQMDLVMSHQGGFPNTVAASGTGLTVAHLEILGRLSNNVVMAFDADSAGIASSGRAARLALARGMDVKIAELPQGVDPADLVREDPEKWRSAIRSAKHVVEFYLDIIFREETDARKRELRARELIVPFVADIGNRIDQAHFISLVATRLGVPEDAVREEVQKMARAQAIERAREEQREARTTPDSRVTTVSGVEEKSRRNTRRETLERSLSGLTFFEADLPESVSIEMIAEAFLRITGEPLAKRAERYAHEREALIFEIELLLSDPHPEHLLRSWLYEFELLDIKERLGELVMAQREAERTQDEVALHAIEEEVRALSQRRMALEAALKEEGSVLPS